MQLIIRFGFLHCECTFLVHAQLLIHKNCQVLLCKAALSDLVSSSTHVSPCLTQVQHLEFGFLELDEILVGPLMKFVQVQDPGWDHVPLLCQLHC